MRKIFFLFILTILFLASCGQGEDNPDSEDTAVKGYQVELDDIEMKDTKINIDSVNDDENANQNDNSSSLDGITENNVLTGEVIEKENNVFLLDVNEDGEKLAETIWVTVKEAELFNEIDIGQTVSIWFEMIRESFPPQTDALKVEIH